MNISYSFESIEDLKRLRHFIEIKDPAAAQKIAYSLKEAIKQLKSFPFMGVMVELAPDPEMIRDLIVGDYIVRYLIRGNEIYILRVWHQKENEKNITGIVST